MAGRGLERRTFLKLCGTAAIGSGLVLQPVNLTAEDNDNRNVRFRLSKPEWIIYENGSYDLVSEEIILKNCRPAINGQGVMPKNVFLGDSPKGKRIVYELPGGFLMLDLKSNRNSISIGAELSGFSKAPKWFYPISQAEIFGADRFFKQGFGTGGQSGVYKLQNEKEVISFSENWSFDSYLAFGFLGKNETIAIGNIDHNDFLQRSTIYNRTHRTGLSGREVVDEQLLFESGIQLDEIHIKNEYIKLPELHFYAGNKPLETLQELVWNQAEKTEARQGSATSYHWIPESQPHSLENISAEIDYIEKLNPPLPVQSIVIGKGYCIIGDWLEMNENWPGGLDRAAREIFKKGFRAGIWIAPFLVSENSKLFKQNPDWIIKDYNNRPIPEETGEQSQCYALDITHEEVLKYLVKVFKSLSKAGFIFYETAYLSAGFQNSKKIKKANPNLSTVQAFRNALKIIREEIGSGGLLIADHVPFSPAIGYVDIVKTGNEKKKGWSTDNVDATIKEDFLCHYFNNLLWQNDYGPIFLSTNDLNYTEQEKMSLALWNGILGGAVSTSSNISQLTNDQIDLFRFLEPSRRFKNAYLPFWPDLEEIKIAVRDYKSLRSWGVLFFNDKNIRVDKSYSVEDLLGTNSVYVFGWRPQNPIPFGEMKEITISLEPHESRLFFLSRNNEPPPADLTLAGNFSEGLS